MLCQISIINGHRCSYLLSNINLYYLLLTAIQNVFSAVILEFESIYLHVSELTTIKQVLLVSAITYLLICLYFGSRWLIFARHNLNSTPEEVFLSFTILLLVIIFSPLAIPFYCYQIIKK